MSAEGRDTGRPLVTVVIGSYNHERFLGRALQAVEESTYPNLQVIVADDASRDASPEIIAAWIARRRPDATFIRHETNAGVCRTLNEALDLAEGDYVTMMSADDWMEPHRIERLVEEFEAAPPEVAVVFSGMRFVDVDGAEVGRCHDQPGALPSGWVFPMQLRLGVIPSPTAMVRRSVYDEVGRYREDDVAEDYDMWLRITRRYDVLHVPEILVNYRLSEDQLSKRLSDGVFTYVAACLRRQIGYSAATDEIIHERLAHLAVHDAGADTVAGPVGTDS